MRKIFMATERYLNHEMRCQPISGELLERRARKQWLVTVKKALGVNAA